MYFVLAFTHLCKLGTLKITEIYHRMTWNDDQVPRILEERIIIKKLVIPVPVEVPF